MPEFTKEQHAAASYEAKDACIVAGPGSGKTTVLVERYRRLVEERGFEPHQILAITFTEKAAANMKAKLAEKFRHDPVRSRDFECSAWVSTIHGFCARLLREHAIEAGLDPRFSVLSPRESDTLQWQCLTAALDHITTHRRAETLELIEALHSPSVTGELKDAYDAIRSAGRPIEEVRNKPSPSGPPPELRAMIDELQRLVTAWPLKMTANQGTEKARLLEWCVRAREADDASFFSLDASLAIKLPSVPRSVSDVMKEFRERWDRLRISRLDAWAAPFRAMIFDVLTRFEEEYRNRKTTGGKVDFNDLERYAIALLKNNPDVQRRVHQQFRQIMLDEFQDINGQQSELIFLLRAPDVFFGVGDINQSIYGFRHARPQIFRDYHADVAFRDGQTVSLLHNFRSRNAILKCVQEVLGSESGIEERDLIPGASFAGKDEPSIEVIRVDTNEREAAWIANRVQSLAGTLQIGEPGETRPADFSDFAVLCRNSESMPEILNAFDRAGIPYVCGRRQSFLLSREGLDITALLSVIANPRDSISLATLLRGPFVGISDETLLRLRLLASNLTSGLNKFAHQGTAAEPHLGPAALAAADFSRLTTFCKNLDRWRQDEPIIPRDILLARALTQCGVEWNPNIESFLQLARLTANSMTLPEFLQEIDSLANAAGTESELSDEDQGNCVQVMTAHAAKGLEFPVTIIAGMEKGSRRESRPIFFTEEHGLGMKWRNPASGKEFKDSWAEANSETAKEREKQEDNRLLYVAMTRAEEHLILTYSVAKGKPQNWARLIDSRFNITQTAIQQRDDYDLSVLVTTEDPPPFTHSLRRSAEDEIEYVAPPLIDDQHETTATVTSLAVFGVCPRKYYIQRSLGWNTGRFRSLDIEIEEDDSPDLPASRIGSAVHEILAGITPSEEIPEARRLAEVFLNSDLGKRVATAQRVEREWAFIADIDGTILRGTIDLWFEENGEIHIVDYKTDVQVNTEDYASQLALYAIALEQALGRRPQAGWLHFLRSDTVVEVPLDNSARNLIGALRKAQDELKFDLNEGDHCRSCQFYRSLCPAGMTNSPSASPPDPPQSHPLDP